MQPVPPPQFFDLPFWQGFVSNGLATLIGVGFGIPAALFINRWIENASKKSKKIKILNVLKKELTGCNTTIKDLSCHDTLDELITNSTLIVSRVSTEMWDSFKEGGELGWIDDVVLLAKIGNTYFAVKGIADLANKTHTFCSVNETISSQWNVVLIDAYRMSILHTPEKIEDTLSVIDRVLKNPNEKLKEESIWDKL